MNNRTPLALALVVALLAGPARADGPPAPATPPKGIELVKLTTPQAAGAGFVLPGSRVDVAFINAEKKLVRAAENVLVYAVDTKDNGETTYSLGLDKKQAEAVAKLLRDGAIPRLSLRKPDDK
jgi:hypothetical protein